MPFVRSVLTMRSPLTGCTTRRMRCTLMTEPASHSQSKGGSFSTQNCRPSTKKVTLCTGTLGSIAARSVVTPLM